MKILPSSLLAAFFALAATFAQGGVLDRAFLQTDFSNTLRVGDNVTNSSSVAFASGGNTAQYPYPTGQVPSDGQHIQLRQSVIGHAFAPISAAPLLAEGLRLLAAGVAYGPPSNETSDPVHNPGDPWLINFPGVINPQTGLPYPVATNFFTNETHQAADYYRAALRLDPFNETAAHGLLRTYYERMAALTFAGHNGAERAGSVRVLLGNIQTEISTLEIYALKFYTNATDELNLLTSRPLEAQLFDGSYLHLPAALLAPNRNRLTEADARALAHQAETVFKLGRLKQFNNYRNPMVDPNAANTFTNLIAELAAHRRAIAERKLLLEISPELTLAGRTELGRAGTFLNHIQSLEAAVENGRIAFVAAHDTGSGTPSNPDIQSVFSEYAPDYVPFHALTSVNGVPKRAHDQFLDIAATFLSRAASREGDSTLLNRDFDVNTFAQQQSLSEITNRYFGELGTLCGRIRTDEGRLVPDIVLALFPESDRRQLHAYAGAQEGTGEIGAQWGRIETARVELEIAQQDLLAIYSQMEMKTFVSGEIVAGIDNLADMFFVNGEKLAAMDRQAGEIQAKATIDAAAAQSRGSWLGSVVKLVARGAAAYVTAGASEVVGTAAKAAQIAKIAFRNNAAESQAIDTLGDVANAWQQAKNSKDAAKIQAKAHRKLAEISAKRTEINTLERVAVQHQQAQTQLLLTAEALHALRLQAARQELAILLAEQRLANEFIALANLEGRVQYLLQEYASALALQNSNPLSSPDYRLVRNIKMREAEDAFHLAHRWVYLAAKSVEYRLNTTAETSLIQSKVTGILRARNASTLTTSMDGLANALQSFYLGQSREVNLPGGNHISFRNHIIQRNRLENETNIVSAELQPGGITSAAHWLKFLLDHTVSNQVNGVWVRQKLTIPFSTSLDKWPDSPDAGFKNPLYAKNNHNGVIASTGVEIQFLGTGLGLGGSVPLFRLEYPGASAMREELCAQTGGKRVRYWNIRRPDGSPYLAEGVPGVALASSWGTGTIGFNEFSPANDRWNLILDGTQGPGAAGNAKILEQLEQVTDIRIRFATAYFLSSDCP